MAWWWNIAIALLLFLAVVVWAGCKTVFCCIDPQPIDAAKDIPVDQWQLFKPLIKELQRFGFKPAGCRRAEAIQGTPINMVILRHKTSHTYATLMLGVSSQAASQVTIELNTYWDNGQLLATVNETTHDIYSVNSADHIQWLGHASIEEQINAHRQMFLQLKQNSSPTKLPFKRFLAAQRQHDQAYYARLAKRREIFWVQPQQTYRMAPWTAIRAFIRVGLGWKRPKDSSSRSLTHAPSNVPSHDQQSGQPTDQQRGQQGGQPPKTDRMGTTYEIEAEVAAFTRSQQQSKNAPNLRHRTFILLASLAFFLVASSSMFDGSLNWQGLLAFAGVIAIHEGGHALAMKAFGYRDTTVLFVPFFGALATAKKENATLTEKVWISLAGPLPGIMMGIGLAIARSQGWVPDVDWIDETMGFFLFLNLFNLIPIYPLDGGQVANNLLFSRNPYLGVVFQSIGIIVLALLGLGTGSFLLLGFAALIAFSIPQSFRTAKLNAQLRQELLSHSPVKIQGEILTSPSGLTEGDGGEIDSTGAVEELDTQTWLRRIFTALQTPPYGHLTAAKKNALAKSLLDSRREHMAPLSTRVGLSGVYLASLILGGIGSVYALTLKPATSSIANRSTASEISATLPPAASDADYFERFYDEEFTDYQDNAYLSDYEPDVNSGYVCPASETSALSAGTESLGSEPQGTGDGLDTGTGTGDVMRDRQMTLIATFEDEAIAQSVLTSLQPSFIPSDRALIFGQSILISTISQTTQRQLESATADQGGTMLPSDDLEYGVSVYIEAEAPDAQTAKQVAQTFWLAEDVTMYDTYYVPPMPWESAELPSEQQTVSERAKYTYHRLNQIEQEAWSDAPIRGYAWKGILSALTQNPNWMLNEQKKMMEKQIQSIREGGQALLNSGDPYLDGETIRLYLEQANLQHRLSQMEMDVMWAYQDELSSANNASSTPDQTPKLQNSELQNSELQNSELQNPNQQARQNIQKKLHEIQKRLGQRIWQMTSGYAAEAAPIDYAALEHGYVDRPWFNGYVQYDGTRVQLNELNFSSVSEMLPDLTQYLCDRQFTNIRYTFIDGAEIWDY